MAKVIGTAENGYLVQMTRDEIARWAGYYWGGQEGCPKIEPGVEIAISSIYQRLSGLERSAAKLRSAAKDFREMADLCESKAPLLFPEPKKKEAQNS